MGAEMEARLGAMSARDRVGVALDAAERVAPTLKHEPYVAKLIDPALAEARHWQQGQPIPARRLYGHIHPLLQAAADDELAGQQLAAFWAMIYALYYTTWHARSEEGAVGPPLPNDICEVSEQTLLECVEYAKQVEA